MSGTIEGNENAILFSETAAPPFNKTLTIVEGKLRLDMLFEQCYNIINNAQSLRANIFVILRPVSGRNANNALVANETTELGAGMDFMPFLEYQILLPIAGRGIVVCQHGMVDRWCQQIFLAYTGRLE